MEGSCYVFSSASFYSCHLHQRIISSASSTVIRVKPLHLLGVSCNIIPILNNNNIYYPLRFLCSSSSSSSFTSSTSSRGTSSSLVPRPTCALIIDDEALDKSIDDHHSLHHSSSSSSSSSSPTDREMLPKIDKSGRFCSPRAARELALSILYAACLQGSDPVRLFEKRLNARREAGYEFDKAYLTEYNHMSFGGPPVNVDSSEEANALQRLDDQESHIEAQVLSAPPKLVYSKLILRFTRKLLVAVVDKWDNHVLVIDKVAPPNWKHEPAGRILEFSILHLAMAEIVVLGTRHQIVINEAVDLAKRFCDGAAPRIINGCLRTFVKNLKGSGDAEETKAKHAVIS